MKIFMRTITCFLAIALIAGPTTATASSLQDYVSDIPAIGLIADEVNFEGIRLKNLRFSESGKETDEIVIGDKYIITTPNQKHEVSVEYAIDADILTLLDLHHFIYGLHNDGPQNCLLHSMGINNSKGIAYFNLETPKKPGIYQLRFCHAEGYGFFDEVKDAWWHDTSATADTIMAIVIVHQ